ncbi:site-specific integrase [Sagittula sp. NFXS13]|uniref:tyrosine-type recombinase/integrase n=1 Tax=Sagittula sp. NFXS13 TaxID=2819095 RepID=UPI0032DF063D
MEKHGVRRSKVWPTKRQAQDWAARQEYLIVNGEKVATEQSLSSLFDRYLREVSPGKRGHRWEIVRLERLKRDKIAAIRLCDLGASNFADWRDRRLREVAPGSVKREMNLIGSVLSTAVKEWGLMPSNPMSTVKKPKEPAARNRLPTDDELSRLRHVAGENLGTLMGRAFHAFLFSGATAMRAGEIVGLTADMVDLVGRVAHLKMTKNGTARDVPLSSEAVALLKALPEVDDGTPIFGLTSRNLDALWRKVRDKAAIEDLTFHDARAWALTKMSRKVDALTLAKISGHRDLKLLLNVYYRESAADIAARLD